MKRKYAEIENDLVVRIVTVNESDCLDSDGVFSETSAQRYLQEVYKPGEFLETREDGTLRRFHAEVGGSYLREVDEFRPLRPGPDYEWDDIEGIWKDPNAPVLTDEEIEALIAQLGSGDTE